jgi:hypothetical protein
LRPTSIRTGVVARTAIRTIRLFRALAGGLVKSLLAIVIVFEEWGWRPLADALARLARFPFVARLEAMVASLPPYPALAVFTLPSVLLLPLKLLSLWLVAGGHVLLAGLLFAAAKVAGTALVARIFQLTQPALMRLGWFRWLYETIMPWKTALLDGLRASWAWRYGRIVKHRVRNAIRTWWQRLRPTLMPAIAMLRATLARLTRRG